MATLEEKIEEANWYLTLIDVMFLDHKKKRLSRYSIEWGKWSREMNLKLQVRMKENLLLKQVFGYWIIMSKLLESYYKTPAFKKAYKSRLIKDGRSLKKDIKEGNADVRAVNDLIAKEIASGTHR